MIRRIIILAITLMALSWLAKKMHRHCSHEEKRMEPVTTKLRQYMDR